MGRFETIMVVMGLFTGFLIPLLVMMIKLTIKWTRVEEGLHKVVSDLNEIVESKKADHAEIVDKMNTMATQLDRRLRWLEENRWIGRQR